MGVLTDIFNRALTDDEAVTFAVLYGAKFAYFDYGHPERSMARQYWTCEGLGIMQYGHIQAHAARGWLRRALMSGKIER
jgi:hypothetical protein